MSNQHREGSLGWQSILYYKFIHRGQYRVDELAAKLGVAVDTLYRYVRGDLIMPPDRIARLIEVTGDIELLEFFCAPAGYIPVKGVAPIDSHGRTDKHVLCLSILTGRAQETIDKALEDGRIEKREYAEIQKYLTRLQQKAAELQEKIRSEVKG